MTARRAEWGWKSYLVPRCRRASNIEPTLKNISSSQEQKFNHDCWYGGCYYIVPKINNLGVKRGERGEGRGERGEGRGERGEGRGERGCVEGRGSREWERGEQSGIDRRTKDEGR